MREVADTGSFDCVVSHEGTAWSVRCSGELDLEAAERFRMAAEGALRERPSSLTLDYSDLTFVDSVGIRATVVTAKVCSERGIDLALVLGPRVGRLFSTLGITGGVLGAKVENPYAR